jgi:hypothetical protein
MRVLAEHWNGNKWSIMAAADQPGRRTVLSDVACADANRCTAVGYFYDTDHRYKPFVEGWNGTKWSVMNVPNRIGSTYTALSGVACPDASSCFAVGYTLQNTTYKTLVEHWNGRRWSIMTSPTPGGLQYVALNRVTCLTRTNCFAVGNRLGANTAGTLVEYWNGTTWRVQLTPHSAATATAGLSDVSCSSLKQCFAVGYQPNNPGTWPLIEGWNGIKWSVSSSPKPSGGNSSALTGVTCASASDCFAVGGHSGRTRSQTRVEHWNGNSWRIQPSPSPSRSEAASLSRVACVSATECFAVGQSGATTLVERYA